MKLGRFEVSSLPVRPIYEIIQEAYSSILKCLRKKKKNFYGVKALMKMRLSEENRTRIF